MTIGLDVEYVRGVVKAALEEDGSLRGHIYFHLGDDSGFRAVRAEDAPKSEAESDPRG